VRIKRLLISSELFCQLFTQGPHHGYRVIEQAIPEDASVRNVRMGWPAAQLEVVLESRTFEDLRAGDEIPFLTPVLMNGVHAEAPDA
jgi:hypothetical protein